VPLHETDDLPTSEGLTQRHKQRTRRELATAAAKLFLERGYAATTVQAIAEAADVSARTFFRYFPAKDDVVTAIVGTGTDDLIEHLERHPEDRSLRDALCGALGAVAAQVCDDPATSRAFRRMVRSTPALHGRWLEEQRWNRHRLADALEPWFPGPDGAPTRYLAAGVAQLALETALDLWTDDPSLSDPFDLLEESLAGLDGPLLSTRRH